jgi:hypothetical protein
VELDLHVIMYTLRFQEVQISNHMQEELCFVPLDVAFTLERLSDELNTSVPGKIDWDASLLEAST